MVGRQTTYPLSGVKKRFIERCPIERCPPLTLIEQWRSELAPEILDSLPSPGISDNDRAISFGERPISALEGGFHRIGPIAFQIPASLNPGLEKRKTKRER